MNIIEPKILDDNKLTCVLGVLRTENGKLIADELYEMLSQKYNVYKVEQEPPGKEFEYPAIKFAIDLCKTKKLSKILYLHTKGACYERKISTQVRRLLWKQEFIDNTDWYVETCNTNKPTVACPATNSSGTTWYNGFFINLSACESVTLKKELCNRYYYEHIFCQPVNKGIKVVGRLFNDIGEGINLPSHKKMNDYIMNLKVEDTAIDTEIVSNVKKKRVIYTCITGGYEMLAPLTNRQSDFDYVCFTDNSGQTSSFWELRPIPDELSGLSSVKQQRLIKICPHRYLPEYDESLWIDGSIDVISNPNTFIDKYCSDKDKSVFIRKHPSRNCIYSEGLACLKLKKDTSGNINPQLERYKKEGFPKSFGLVESNIVYRKHNDPYCIKLMDMWAIELLNGSHRDQLSFNYALWKVGNNGFKYLASNLIRGGCFKWYVAHNRNKYINSSEKKKLLPSKEPASLSITKKNKNTKAINTSKNKPLVTSSQIQKQTHASITVHNTGLVISGLGRKFVQPTNIVNEKTKTIDKPKVVSPTKPKTVKITKNKPVNIVQQKPVEVITEKKPKIISKQCTRVLSRRVDNISKKK